MTELQQRRVVLRFLLLRVSRWLPAGLIIPVLVLYLVDRGLSLAQVGIAFAAQGLVVMLLEIPTGGLADALGRKPVLVAANIFEIISLVLMVIGTSVTWFAAAFAVQGVYRALESGPLEAWFVDAVKAANPAYDIERGLGKGGMVLGVAIAAGSLSSGLLVSLHPIDFVDALALPILIALALRLLDTGLVLALMTETRSRKRHGLVKQEVVRVPAIIREVSSLMRSSAPLALVVAVELFWGFGMATFENLFPPRLGEVVGGAQQAAALMGPVAAVAWLSSSAGALTVSWFSRRFGRHTTAAWMRIMQGSSVAAMGLLGGPAGLITAYLVCYLIHGAANPVHLTLLHAEATAGNRTTVLSVNSMAGQASGAIGVIALGAIADSHGTTTGMFVGALILAAAAPLYLLAARASNRLDGAASQSD